ncbi:MAG: helix-turn-helix transcriptional regulator [Bacteroidetes bacterium]|nr:helix-turn-helix transcriptional regulator [Bacteroidota bacterium]
MKLYVKNMVCKRCKMVVKDELVKFGLHPSSVELGEVVIQEELDEGQKEKLNTIMLSYGFELIDDKKSRIIEKIKTLIVELVHYSEEQLPVKLSEHISSQIHHDYNYLSNLFSAVEGITIEKYFITQRIERVKELIAYDELSLSEIAVKMNYSSIAYLSRQFKQVTGFTPSNFKLLKKKERKNIEDL